MVGQEHGRIAPHLKLIGTLTRPCGLLGNKRALFRVHQDRLKHCGSAETMAETLTPSPMELAELRIYVWSEREDAIEVRAEFTSLEAPCPRCGTVSRSVYDHRPQRKRDQLDGRPLWLVLLKRRFRCSNCQTVFTEPDPLCGQRRRTTKRFRALLRDALRKETPGAVARSYGVSRSQVLRALREASRPA
jgi:transposase-like protein